MANEKVAFRALILTPCRNADLVGRVQRELVMALDNYVLVKKSTRHSAQRTLMEQAPTSQVTIENRIQQNNQASQQKIINQGLTGKAKRTEQNAAFNQKFVIRHEIADPIVQGFEVSYAATRTNKEEVYARIEQAADYIGLKQFITCGYNNGSKDNWIVTMFNGDKHIPIIELWFGASRFIETGTEKVFQHRTKPDRDYVRDRHGFFIARYLIRNLSEYDRTEKINKVPVPDPLLTAKADRIPEDGTLITDITTHVRAKEASGGDTCFLSFSHTKHAIVGSTAKLFYTQKNGDIIVDASKVEQRALVDVHSLDAVKKIFGVDTVKPTMPFAEGDDSYEKNAAARDTVRTREILIAGHVPKAAAVAVRLSTETVKAAWTQVGGGGAILPAGIPDSWRT